MESVKAAAAARKRKKKKQQQVKDDGIKQAEKKKRRLEKALATSAAIRSELLDKKQKKIEEQERLLEEEWTSFAAHLAASGKQPGANGILGMKIEHAPAQVLGVGRSTVNRLNYIKKNPPLFEAARKNLPAPESETVMVKARYEDEIIKFKLCGSSTMKKLLEEVGRRLDLEMGSFKLRYLDEDNDNILLACDDDLQLCLKNLTAGGDKTTMNLFVQLISDCIGI